MLAGFALLMAALTSITAAAITWAWPMLDRWTLAPRVAFRALPPLPQDAYRQPSAWLARPDLPADPARYLPPGMHPAQLRGTDPGTAPGRAPGTAYVFFLHPTTFLARNAWNEPIERGRARNRTALVLRSMASVFNDQAGVYAPRYRQAALGTFLIDDDDQQRALAVAQGDAQAALATFLTRVPPDAPIVLAGQDQGALILMRLIRNSLIRRATGAHPVADRPVADRIVAVYLAGWPVSIRHDLPQLGMPACTRPDQAACVAAGTTFARPADPTEVLAMVARYPALDGTRGETRATDRALCTNPLTGGAGADAPATANLGSLATRDEIAPATIVYPSVAARCDPRSGLLLIDHPPHLGDDVRPGNNYAMYDYALFWRNLRNDVARREAAWRRAHHAP